ncbi:hypothetical protein CTAYLR_007366 [Chrysophaeum taylorii]|uniref:AAA+ ATPase domain-containing protein n=1 Tax=Chrysophaeum taylorii TaxID=2483200 RepID=A0AAD7XHA1_9STRA|nr:hypothetical protein CTAYLR_007366 [Chrysophaeum taylorii]
MSGGRLVVVVVKKRWFSATKPQQPPVLWPRPESPEWLALSRRPPDKEVPVDVAMGYDKATTLHRKKPFVEEAVAQDARREDSSSRSSLILRRSTVFEGPKKATTEGAKRLAAFRMTPREIKAALDQRVIGQTEAKKAISVSISEHYHHARQCLEDPSRLAKHFHKPNMMLWGPSGSGKSHLIRAAADLACAPLVKCDATQYSATGYVGRDVGEVVSQLVDAADGDLDAARFGLVYIDEVDKICDKKGLSGLSTPGVNTRDVQCSLLKLLEDFELPVAQLRASPPLSTARRDAKATFSTKHVLFVFAGAFEDANHREALDASDFVDLGLLREFVGRVPVRVRLRELSVDDLRQILATPSDVSPLSRYVEAFAAHGIRFTYDDDALALIATKAHAQRLGARALLTEVEATLRDFSYHLPSCDLRDFHLDAPTVHDPRTALRSLLSVGDDVDIDTLL